MGFKTEHKTLSRSSGQGVMGNRSGRRVKRGIKTAGKGFHGDKYAVYTYIKFVKNISN